MAAAAEAGMLQLTWDGRRRWADQVILCLQKNDIYIFLKSKHKWLEIFDKLFSLQIPTFGIYILEETDISIETQDFRYGQQLHGFSRASQSYSRR